MLQVCFRSDGPALVCRACSDLLSLLWFVGGLALAFEVPRHSPCVSKGFLGLLCLLGFLLVIGLAEDDLVLLWQARLALGLLGLLLVCWVCCRWIGAAGFVGAVWFDEFSWVCWDCFGLLGVLGLVGLVWVCWACLRLSGFCWSWACLLCLASYGLLGLLGFVRLARVCWACLGLLSLPCCVGLV
jgi:hypothetical protein